MDAGRPEIKVLPAPALQKGHSEIVISCEVEFTVRTADMNPDAKTFIAAGAIAAFLAVAFGAFGAHALRDRLEPDLVAIYRTAVEYHFWHALGLIALGLAAPLLPASSLIRWAGWVMVAGMVLFSGSLYVLALTGTRALGAVTPVGGLCLLSAWALLAVAVLRA